nr:hypothetical protein GCM10025730_10830 [Promicromonospora thailandica]
MGAGRFIVAGVVAAAATVLTRRTLDEKVAAGGLGGASTWTRTNHRGEPISLLEGPAVTAGLVAGAAVSGGTAPGAKAFATAAAGPSAWSTTSPRTRPSAPRASAVTSARSGRAA